MVETFYFLQSAFDVLQSQLSKLKLVLNTDQTKLMLFSNGKELPTNMPKLLTTHKVEIERVNLYKYLGFIIDEKLSFKLHIGKLVSRLKIKLLLFFLEINLASQCRPGNICSLQPFYLCWITVTCYL